MKKTLLSIAAASALTVSTAQAAPQYFMMVMLNSSAGTSQPAPYPQPSSWSELASQSGGYYDPAYSGGAIIDVRDDTRVKYLPTVVFPSSTPYAIYLAGTSIENVDSLSSVTGVTTVIDLSNNNISDVSGLSNLSGTTFSKLDLSGNNLTNLAGFPASTVDVDTLDLRNNPGLVDLSALDAANGGMIGYEIFIDAGISARAGFVPISGSSYLCNTYFAPYFKDAPQTEVCVSTWT